MSSSHATDEAFWERIRDAYPRQQPLLNLNNAAVSPPPLVVERAMIDAYRLISHNPDVNMWSKLDAALPAIKQQQLAQLADCSPEEIALNRNTSEGLSTAIFGIPLTAGNQAMISAWDSWMHSGESSDMAEHAVLQRPPWAPRTVEDYQPRLP